MLHDFMFNVSVEFKNKLKKLGCHLKNQKISIYSLWKINWDWKHLVEDNVNKKIKNLI